jgi:F-type H+-transporting ATPase subunit delta
MVRRVDDRQLAVARVYAESLFALAEERGAADATLIELESLAGLLESDSDLTAFFSSPLVDQEARRAVLDKSLGDRASELVVATLQVMNNKDRLGLLEALAVSYRRVLDERRGRVDVAVLTAAELTPALRDRLRATLERVTGREVRLAETVDPEALGGMVISVGDRKIDYSLATDLRQLDDKLRDRATREIHSVTE